MTNDELKVWAVEMLDNGYSFSDLCEMCDENEVEILEDMEFFN